MDFLDIARTRQSCRSYDPDRPVEREKLDAILEAARLAPSACNSQRYILSVCTGENAKSIAETTMKAGMNAFTADVPLIIVVSEKLENKGILGTLVPVHSYSAVDIGVVAAYITAEATTQGLGSCILGWFDEERIKEICGIDGRVRLVITLGYAKEGDPLRPKIRKDISELVNEVE